MMVLRWLMSWSYTQAVSVLFAAELVMDRGDHLGSLAEKSSLLR